ncbi:hypothetical protein J1N35_007202 [Gossypium stocksii]|uniref:Uncharacterized protein n=1 Tax=Gossypium stocksii TaxID=47602 RepID=A0A9D3W615_9ROSI|nr:hypothetical protein J1N35_007202 [Gossypium stocksii]
MRVVAIYSSGFSDHEGSFLIYSANPERTSFRLSALLPLLPVPGTAAAYF